MFNRVQRAALIASVAVTYAAMRAFNNGGWKMDGENLAKDASGNPIWVKADASEQSVEGGTIARLNGEAQSHRERAERAETALNAFKDIKDPAAAVKALETVSKLDQKRLIDAGEVDRVRHEISTQFQAQLDESKKERETLQGTINNMTVENAFNGSEFIRENIITPPEMFRNTFARNFKVEDGKIIPTNASGQPLLSKKKMGEVASFDEAIEIYVGDYQYKDAIMKAPNKSGAGNGGNGGNRGGSRSIRRAEFDALEPMQQAEIMQKGEVTVSD